MANRVLGIEIGQNLTRVVEIDYKTKNPKVHSMFSFPTPPEMIDDGVVHADSIFRSMLYSKIKEKKINTNKVVFTLNSTRIASREMELPLVKEKQIKDILQMNASDYFPVDLSQYKLVHEVIEKIDKPEEKKMRLSVIAIPNEIISSYEELAADCRLQIVALDYSGNAIKQLMLREIPGDIKATIKIDETISTITVMDGDIIKLQRNVNYGLADAIEEIQDSELFGEYLSFTDAVDVARRKTCLELKSDVIQPEIENAERDDMGHEIDSERFKKLRANVNYTLANLVSSLGRVIDYYQSRNVDRPIDRIFLVGLGADFSGLSKLLTNELNYKVIPLQQFDGISVAKNINLAETKIAEFFNCVGATLKPLPITDEKKAKGNIFTTPIGGMNNVPMEQGAQPPLGPDGQPLPMPDGMEEQKGASLGIPLIILGVCVVASVGLIAYSIFANLVLTSDNMALKGRVSDLSYAQNIYDVYNQTKSDYEWTKLLQDASSNKNDEIVSFIDELEKKLPS
ncbi:pilus assembly protein PilM, partial [Agathobacter sp.]|uniref:pilus assembly protein PilM n=1 Tax=Agathobacter sp. TaxID=2021311 RepID=UPI002A91EC44